VLPLITARLLSKEAITIGRNEDRDLTKRRREGNFRENQTFNTIFYLRVAKLQHNRFDVRHSRSIPTYASDFVVAADIVDSQAELFARQLGMELRFVSREKRSHARSTLGFLQVR
jgi:hypothetical protein